MSEKRGLDISKVASLSQAKRRGQVTLFIILALIIVGVGVVIYLFYPQIQSLTGLQIQNPQAYIQTCMKSDIQNAINNLSLQGGVMNPGHYILYDNNEIEYLCYTNKDLQPCVMQQPLLRASIESQIENAIKTKEDSCFSALEKSYKDRGYTTTLTGGGANVSLLPSRVRTSFNYNLTITKGNTQRFTQFNILTNSNLYELTGIAMNILYWEVDKGDVDTGMYMLYYHNILVEKKEQSDGTKIYIITDVNSKDKFQFATRSFAWPAGFGASI